MSREIRFRCWNNCLREYIPEDELMDSFGECLKEKHLYIEQYTGLTDKNGKEIYEGDIVEFGLSGRAERGYVAYADEYTSFEVYSKRDFIFGCLFGHAGIVIGNIHQNPELLGGEE